MKYLQESLQQLAPSPHPSSKKGDFQTLPRYLGDRHAIYQLCHWSKINLTVRTTQSTNSMYNYNRAERRQIRSLNFSQSMNYRFYRNDNSANIF